MSTARLKEGSHWMRPKSDKLHTQIGRNYRNTCVRKPNSSAELCEEAFYTHPSNSFNPSRVNNEPTQRRHCTPWKWKTAEGEVISSPSYFKHKPTKFLIIFLKLKKTNFGIEKGQEIYSWATESSRRLTALQQKPSLCYSEKKKKFAWKGKFRTENASEHCNLKWKPTE